MARIAYMTSRTYRGAHMAAGELPAIERVGRELVGKAGEKHGLQFETIFWDQPDLLQRGFDAAIIRSCWDYTDRTDEFVATLQSFERAELPVFNSSEVVRWNGRKTYLKELGDAAIETVWAERFDADVLNAAFDALGVDEVVAKPQVGAGSRETVRLTRDGWSAADLAAGPRALL